MISVIIPCYNASSFIIETLKSIIDQKIDGFEIIVVDDGSTDNSANLIKLLGNPHIKYHYQVNKGVSAARNYGLQYANGEYVIFFDADDLMSPEFLTKRVAALENDMNIGFSCGPVNTFPSVNKPTYGVAEDGVEKLLTYQPQYSSCPSNYLIRKSVLINNNIRFNENLSSTADRFFLIELVRNTKGALIQEAPLLYRINPNSMSNKLSSKLILDNENYFVELKKHDLIPSTVKDEFIFKIQYILGLGFLRTGVFDKGLKYTLSAFSRNPGKFISNILLK
jgi:teichuronic acid biosynthesis glycosyltransferase TuaG